MTYDPKLNSLSTIRDTSNGGLLSVSFGESTHMEPVQPSALQKFLAIAKPIAAIVVTLAGAVLAAGQGGLALPAWLVGICTALVSIGAGLGIASSGVAPKAPLAAPVAPEFALKDLPPAEAAASHKTEGPPP